MEKIFKKLRHISLKKDGRFLGFGASPEDDWKVIVYATVLLTLGMFIFNTYIFIKIDKGEIFMTERSTEANQTLDMQKLESVVSYYLDKQVEYEGIKNTGASVPDPSI